MTSNRWRRICGNDLWPYLVENHPEFGITAESEWTPTITKPQILVVMHYLSFSEEWEMGIMRHVTVPEHAWSRMYLRPRDAMAPTFGLEIPSYLDPDPVGPDPRPGSTADVSCERNPGIGSRWTQT